MSSLAGRGGSMHEYRLYGARWFFVLLVCLPVGFALVAVTLLVSGVLTSQPLVPLLPFAAALGIVSIVAVTQLRYPTRIEWHGDGTVVFAGWMRHLAVPASEIRSIRPGGKIGFLRVRTDRGSLTLLAQFDGFHEFLTRLEQANPSVEIRGC